MQIYNAPPTKRQSRDDHPPHVRARVERDLLLIHTFMDTTSTEMYDLYPLVFFDVSQSPEDSCYSEQYQGWGLFSNIFSCILLLFEERRKHCYLKLRDQESFQQI